MPRTRITGYAPDQDATTAGVITDCAAALPGVRGMYGAPSAVTTPLPALAAACVGAAIVRKQDETTRFFAGTATALFEAATTSWTTVTRAAGGAYTVASGYRWSFAQYGTNSLAIQKGDKLQVSASGAFADVAAAPKASIVETVGQFVMLFDTSEATYGDSPDRWWCSASGDYTNWTPAVATECATGRLISAPGSIRAARAFGEQIAVYKGRAMWLGTYQGAPEVWRFDAVPGEIGAVSQNAVVNVGTTSYPKHLFQGMDDFYSFDGSRPVSIGAGWVKEAVYGEISFANIRLCSCSHDPVNSLVYFYYPTEATLNKCVVYNYLTKQWGRDDRAVQSVASYITPGVTYADLGTYYATYADLPNVAYDANFLVVGATTPVIFNASNVLQTLNGIPGASYITTGDMGDEQNFSLITRIRPLFLIKPTSSTATNYYRENLGDGLTTDQTVAFSNGKYDLIRSSRWHRLQIGFVGKWEMNSFNVYAVNEGEQ